MIHETTTDVEKCIDPARKAELIDEYRNINVEHDDWWDCTYSDFISDCADAGIEVFTDTVQTSKRSYARPSIYFSVFWYQGDGACFNGRVADWAKFLGEDVAKFPRLMQLNAQAPTLYASWYTSGNYNHKHTLSFDVSSDTFDGSEEPLTQAVVDVWNAELEAELGTLEDYIKDRVHALCDKLYSTLKQAHEYQTSDEAVWEYIEANNLDTPGEDDGSETD
jgi:hypothetical protein